MTDVRIHCGLRSHRKIEKLRRRLGRSACWSWICLLLHVGEFRPDGHLGDMTTEDVGIEADVAPDDDADMFVTTLVDLALLDRDDDGSLRVHDWADWNEFAMNAPARSRAGTLANHIRWRKEGKTPCDPYSCRLCSTLSAFRTGSESDPNRTPDPKESDAPRTKAESPSPLLSFPTEEPGAYAPPSRKKRVRSAASTALNWPPHRLAELLLEIQTNRDPNFSAGRTAKKAIEDWGVHIEKLLRLDGRSPDEVENVIRWLPSSWWHTKILSGKSLREKFDRLYAEFQEKKRPPVPASPRTSEGSVPPLRFDETDDDEVHA